MNLIQRIKNNEGYAGVAKHKIGTSSYGTYVGHGSYKTIVKVYKSAGVTKEMAGDLYGKEIVIGYGHMLKGKQLKDYFTKYKVRKYFDNYPKHKAEILLVADVAYFKLRAEELIIEKGLDPTTLTLNQKDVITEMVFQLGKHGMSKFKKFWRYAERGDWSRAAGEIRHSKLYKQAPARTKNYIKGLRPFNGWNATPFTPELAFNPLGLLLLWQVIKKTLSPSLTKKRKKTL